MKLLLLCLALPCVLYASSESGDSSASVSFDEEDTTLSDYCKAANANGVEFQVNGEQVGSSDINVECYWRCIYTHLGFMSEEGEINRSRLYSNEEAENYEYCFNIHEDDPCRTAYEFYKCYEPHHKKA